MRKVVTALLWIVAVPLFVATMWQYQFLSPFSEEFWYNTYAIAVAGQQALANAINGDGYKQAYANFIYSKTGRIL